MSSTTYRLPRNYTAAQLVYAVRFVKAHPADLFSTPDRDNLTAEQYLQWFRKCLHEKISRGEMVGPVFRKFSTTYQLSLYRDAQRLKGYGGFGKTLETPEIRTRLGADHVHTYITGRHSLCSDPHCETRR